MVINLKKLENPSAIITKTSKISKTYEIIQPSLWRVDGYTKSQ